MTTLEKNYKFNDRHALHSLKLTMLAFVFYCNMKLSKGNIELMRESFQAIQFACNYIFWSF